MYTLLVWQEIPEDTKTYLIPNEAIDSNGFWDLMKTAHDKVINGDEMNDGLRFLNAALLDEKYVNDDSMFDDGTVNTMIGNKPVKVKVGEPCPKEWRCVLAKYTPKEI